MTSVLSRDERSVLGDLARALRRPRWARIRYQLLAGWAAVRSVALVVTGLGFVDAAVFTLGTGWGLGAVGVSLLALEAWVKEGGDR